MLPIEIISRGLLPACISLNSLAMLLSLALASKPKRKALLLALKSSNARVVCELAVGRRGREVPEREVVRALSAVLVPRPLLPPALLPPALLILPGSTHASA
mmetsp:Transcript_13166/g.26472  ORF Transcript_13166/g.26472 Transcript_13166/m.26472 type:complete len:102 (-) Transcript_13166:93-398(-)